MSGNLNREKFEKEMDRAKGAYRHSLSIDNPAESEAAKSKLDNYLKKKGLSHALVQRSYERDEIKAGRMQAKTPPKQSAQPRKPDAAKRSNAQKPTGKTPPKNTGGAARGAGKAAAKGAGKAAAKSILKRAGARALALATGPVGAYVQTCMTAFDAGMAIGGGIASMEIAYKHRQAERKAEAARRKSAAARAAAAKQKSHPPQHKPQQAHKPPPKEFDPFPHMPHRKK